VLHLAKDDQNLLRQLILITSHLQDIERVLQLRQVRIIVDIHIMLIALQERRGQLPYILYIEELYLRHLSY
jgi:hypothetical protein